MNEEMAAKALAVTPKTTAVLVDALSPLIQSNGIVAVQVTALVALDENQAVPVVVMLGAHPAAVAALMEAVRGFAAGNTQLLNAEQFPIPKPAQN